jgi:hypothetical protein
VISVRFDKATAERFLDSLVNDRPIELPSRAGWTRDDVLALAGACFFAALSHGPPGYNIADLDKLPKERREAIEEAFRNDLFAAVEVYSRLARLVMDREYDAAGYAARLRGTLKRQAGKRVFVPD